MGNPPKSVFRAVLIIVALLALAVVLVAVAFGAITGDVFGLFSFEVITSFFVGFSGEQIAFGILVVLFWVIPGLGLKFYNYIKNIWGFEDKQAHDFLFAVSFALSAISLLVTGTLELSGLEFNLANFLTTGASIWALSQITFKRLYPSNP